MPIARHHGVSQQDASGRCPQGALQALMPITPYVCSYIKHTICTQKYRITRLNSMGIYRYM